MVVVIQVNMGNDTPWTEVIETSLLVSSNEDSEEDKADILKWLAEINRLGEREQGNVVGDWCVLERARVKKRPVMVDKFITIWN